ncbi:MAG: DUF3179 domain-containing protein, partial [Gemmatimonadetes bacterium]|nr:DUF3179 domain-containing protein [Gemmatimonadota bacterium]
ILIWHEIVNDVVGGQPVAVTYCPLCNTALAFDRRFDGQVLDFGVTGRLRYSDLVMYDRHTESWWQQATGEGIVGRYAGRRLVRVPSTILGWSQARDLHPHISVLSRQTGFTRDYGRNPYVRYDDWGNRPFAGFFPLGADRRFPMMERMVSIDRGGGWAAPVSRLRERRVAQAQVEGLPFVVFWSEGAASAVDDRTTARGREVGQTAVFDRRVDGRVLTFAADRGGFRDRETGSRWDLAGRAVSGPLRGRRLRAVPHENPFWFAWVAFRPNTTVWR